MTKTTQPDTEWRAEIREGTWPWNYSITITRGWIRYDHAWAYTEEGARRRAAWMVEDWKKRVAQREKDPIVLRFPDE